MQASAPLLRIDGLCVRFGAVRALDGVSLDVHPGELVGLIGPNGAGKTTLFNAISRLCAPERGVIELAGASLCALAPHDVARAGVGRTFQHTALFDTQSARDNVRTGAFSRTRRGFLADVLRPRPAFDADRLLARLGVLAHARVPAGELGFAIRKRIELARALAGAPRLLLLDEPAGGLNHDEAAALGALIRGLRDELGLAILMVEHHLGFVMQLSDRVVALDFGKVLAQGTPAEIAAHPEVIRSYLGTPA